MSTKLIVTHSSERVNIAMVPLAPVQTVNEHSGPRVMTWDSGVISKVDINEY